MKTKLSLSIDPNVLEMLDAAAKAHGTSRSAMVERSVRAMFQKPPAAKCKHCGLPKSEWSGDQLCCEDGGSRQGVGGHDFC